MRSGSVQVLMGSSGRISWPPSRLLYVMSALAWKSAAGSFFLYVLVSLIVCLTVAAQSVSPPLASADAAMQSGQFADAARQYEAWLKAHPDSKEVLLALGICYVQLERQNE